MSLNTTQAQSTYTRGGSVPVIEPPYSVYKPPDESLRITTKRRLFAASRQYLTAYQVHVKHLSSGKGGIGMANMAKLSNAEIRKYAVSIESARFPYFCAATGELAENLAYVVRTTIVDLFRHGITHRWKKTAAWQKPQIRAALFFISKFSNTKHIIPLL